MKTKAVDIDGIITVETKGHSKKEYQHRSPNLHNIKTLCDYRRRGFKIVLYSARFLEDYDATVDWLVEHNVPYDEVILGKPQADQYVDDKASKELDREVLCFSGGTDSLIAWHYLNFPQPLYVMMGHRYQTKEINCIGQLKKLIPKLNNVIYYSGPELGRFEVGDNAYIPRRNLMLALCGSYFGNKIYIAGVKGDKVEDKNESVFSIMSFAMNSIKKQNEPTIKIESPFWQMTKTNIIKWFLDNYPKAYVEKVLKTSVSCYDETTMGSCGNCFSCARKWLSLESANIQSYWWFEKDIRNFKGLYDYIDKIKKGHYDIQRANETKQILKKYHIWK